MGQQQEAEERLWQQFARCAAEQLRQRQHTAEVEIRNFSTSNFRAIYDSTPRRPQAETGARRKIERSFIELGREENAVEFMWHTAPGPHKKTIVQAVVHLWTSHDAHGNNAVFQELNRV